MSTISQLSQFTTISELNEQLNSFIDQDIKSQPLSKITELFKTTIEKSITNIDGTLKQIDKIDQQQVSFFNQRIILQRVPKNFQTQLPTIIWQYNSNESLITLFKTDCLEHSSKVVESIELLGKVIDKEEKSENSKSGLFWIISKIHTFIFGSSIERAKTLKTDLEAKLAKLNVSNTCESYVTEIRQNKVIFEHLLTALKQAHTNGSSQEIIDQIAVECRDMGGKSGLSSAEITLKINEQLQAKITA